MSETYLRFSTTIFVICLGLLLVPGCGEETQEAANEIKEGAGEVVDEFTGRRSIERGEQIKRELADIQKQRAAREDPDANE